MAEKSFVYETLLLFLDSYFICGDRETVLQMSTEDIYCIGVQGEAPAFNKEDFGKLLQRHITDDSASAVYEVNGYREKMLSPGNWICYCEIETYMDIDGDKLNLSWWGITLGVQMSQWIYKISLIHLSEMKNWAQRGEALRKLYPDGENPFIESLYRHLEESSRDPLTGLYNRKAGESLINQALNSGGEYIFLLMDIDNFKAVNDVYGHLKGDIMLKYVADKIRKSFRDTDVIFRLGGDEFVVFIYPCKNRQAIEQKLEKIIEDYGKNIREDFPHISSALSWGGVFSGKKRSFTELYQKADKIMYQVKHRGGKGYLIEEE